MGYETVNTSKKVKIVDNLNLYFEHFQFEKKFRLIKDVPLELRWSDVSSLISNVRHKAKAGVNLFYHQKEFVLNTIDSLKSVPLWLKSEDHIIPMTMYDIYHTMGLFIKKNSLETEIFNIYNISFIGPTGPFKEMPLIDCVNDQTLELYIHWMVMTNKLPQRSFRLTTDGRVLAQIFSDAQVSEAYFCVNQITDTGILFKSNSDILLNSIEYAEKIKIYFDTSHLLQVFGSPKAISDVTDFYYTEENLKYFTISSDKLMQNLKYNSHKTGEFFMYCSYHHMQDSEIPYMLKKLTTDLKEIVKESVA